MPPVPAVIYAAKSTADPRGSITTQVADCEAAITSEGGRFIVGQPFSDEAASAFSCNRGEGLAEAKAAAAKAAADHGEAELWVQHSDRLARGDGLTADHLAEVWFAVRRQGVRLRSVQDDSNLEDVIRVALMGERSYEDSKRKAAAVKSGKDRQMERGERLGGPVPDGLRVVVERDAADQVISRRYVIDPDRAEVIREIFALSESGYGDPSIAQRLNRRGIRTQGGRAWSRRRVQDTLTNQTYAGRVVRHRGKADEQIVPATNVEAIIDPERFDALTAKRATRDRSKSGREAAVERGRRGGRPTGRYALSKLARCARCGAPMFCQTSPYRRKDGSQARHYVCSNIRNQTGMCDAPKVDAAAADAAIVPHLERFFLDYAEWSAAVRDAGTEERDRIAGQLADVRAKLAKLSKAEDPAHERYTAALADGDDLTADAALGALRKIRADRSAAMATASDLEAALATMADTAAPSDAMLDYWRGIAEGIRGRLANAEGMADVNAELRVALERVEIDTLIGGAITLRAKYRRGSDDGGDGSAIRIGADGEAVEADSPWSPGSLAAGIIAPGRLPKDAPLWVPSGRGKDSQA